MKAARGFGECRVCSATPNLTSLVRHAVVPTLKVGQGLVGSRRELGRGVGGHVLRGQVLVRKRSAPFAELPTLGLILRQLHAGLCRAFSGKVLVRRLYCGS